MAAIRGMCRPTRIQGEGVVTPLHKSPLQHWLREMPRYLLAFLYTAFIVDLTINCKNENYILARLVMYGVKEVQHIYIQMHMCGSCVYIGVRCFARNYNRHHQADSQICGEILQFRSLNRRVDMMTSLVHPPCAEAREGKGV